MKLKAFFAALILFLTLTIPAMAKTVTIQFAFDRSQEAAISGFRLYESDVSGQYLDAPAMVVGASERTFVFTIPDTDACYAWTVTAFNALYNTEGTRSNEILACIKDGQAILPLPQAAPQIMSITITD